MTDQVRWVDEDPDDAGGGLEGVEALERTLLGGDRALTRPEVSERAGVPIELGRRLWRAMGFADVADDDPVFTEGDVVALQTVCGLIDAGVIDEQTAVVMARALGQSLSRLAEWQVDAHTEMLARRFGGPDVEGGVALSRELLPAVELLLIHVWRRHLAAVAGRAFASSPDELTTRTLAVGFADLVGFTELTRRLGEQELGRLVERFEARASDIVSGRGGRVVKTVGDEVLFVADRVVDGAEIALGLAGGFDDPPVRVGLAWGPVLNRLGDVYGGPVNLASRLTSRARPGTVLVDRELAARLDGAAAYELRRLRRLSVRGYDHLEVSVLRRAEEAASAE